PRPSSAEAYATACAWFPADQVITPRDRSSGASHDSLLSTPRALNEPVRWKSSAFKYARSTPTVRARVAEEKVGVRWTRSPIVSRAASTSSRVTGGSATRRSFAGVDEPARLGQS